MSTNAARVRAITDKAMLMVQAAVSPAVREVAERNGWKFTRDEWNLIRDDALDRLRFIRRKLITGQPFLARVITFMAYRVSVRFETMATDGRYCVVNPFFLDGLSDEEAVFVLCHEALHAGLGHPWRRGNRNPERWNVACDYVVNAILVAAGMSIPMKEGQINGLLDPRFAGGWIDECDQSRGFKGPIMCAEEVYAILDREGSTPTRPKDDPTGGHDHWEDDSPIWPHEKPEPPPEPQGDDEEGEDGSGEGPKGDEDEDEEDGGGYGGQEDGEPDEDGEGGGEGESEEDDPGPSPRGKGKGEGEDEGGDWQEESGGGEGGEGEEGESGNDPSRDKEGGGGIGEGTTDRIHEDSGEEHWPWDLEEEDEGIGNPLETDPNKLEDTWRDVTRQAEEEDRMLGRDSVGAAAMGDALRAAESITDWRAELATYLSRRAGMNKRTDWTRLKKYQMPGGGRYWLPKKSKWGVKVGMILDVSGSVSSKAREQFMGEVIQILKALDGAKLDILLMTSYICGEPWRNVREADLPAIADSVKRTSGGTQFDQGWKWFEDLPKADRPDVVICLTDGEVYTRLPRPSYDVLWVVTIPGDYDKPWGRVLRMDEHQR